MTGVLILPSSAFAAQSLDWGDGTDFRIFGPNEAVTIDVGQMNIVSSCPTGIDDVFFPFTDIYVVPSGSRALSGAPNTVQGDSQGTFASETIAFTAPSGALGEGDYAVIYDECQDGSFDASVDFVVDPAIQVQPIPSDVPPLPSIAAFKSAAAAEAVHWQFAHLYFEIVFKLGDKWDRSPKIYAEIVGPTLERARGAALSALLNTATHWEGLAADPPDPNFQVLTPLAAHETIVSESQDALLEAGIGLGSDAGNEDAIAAALLSSLERYQGADEAGNGEWALIHARAIRAYADLLAGAIGQTTDSSADARAAFTADSGEFAAIASEFEALRAQVESSGFSAADTRELRNLGLNDAEIQQLRTDLANADFAFDEAELLSRLSAIESNASALISELQALSTNMGSLIATLEADASVADDAPVADAGGPYSGSEGTAISLDGSDSTSPSSVTAYEWDVDGDGDFDDASGASPTFTFQQAFDGFVGLRVTNSAGRSNVAYAQIHIDDANARPRFASFSPLNRTPEVIAGGASLAFSVVTPDPDGDPVTVQWFVDGNPVATGGSFTYAPAAGDLGLHEIRSVASDDSPLGGSVELRWVVAVLLPDSDSDLWHANVDCSDTDAAVNPGQTEVLGNGKDDDCDPTTSDGPSTRMVGKGAMTGTPGGAGSYAYIVRCNSSQNTNAPFEVRFGSQRFRLTSTSAVSCTNDPAVTTPAIGFDTMTGTGAGTLTSGGPGTIQWKFVDAGTSGTGDSAQITIRNAGGTIIFQGSSGPPGQFPGSSQGTGNNTAQAVPSSGSS